MKESVFHVRSILLMVMKQQTVMYAIKSFTAIMLIRTFVHRQHHWMICLNLMGEGLVRLVKLLQNA
mgnify:CR=1 FL=1